jgi:chemotaxis protein methyltransferase CheR
METSISDDLLSRFSEFVARRTGLDFPPIRWADLQRGIAEMARVMEFESPSDCARLLMSKAPSKRELETLVGQLTVGETYFFRDPAAFEALEQHILPLLVRERTGTTRQLRIWSAACCTGEEAYSIAIAVRRAIPDWQEWNLHILATDINPQFLIRAESGLFGKWSFRDAPLWLQAQYFRRVSEGQFEISPEIRRMVRFADLNLVDDAYPSLVNETNAMDVIFCRNVLMYFTQQQAGKVLGNLHRAQIQGGWLFVSPSDWPHISGSSYVATSFSGATVYRKRQRQQDISFQSQPLSVTSQHPQTNAASPPAPVAERTRAPSAGATYSEAITLYAQGRYSEVVDRLKTATNGRSQEAVLDLLTRSLANLGRLTDALGCCDKWIQGDGLNPNAHYLRAVVLEEQGEWEEAARSLRKALYIDPKFPMAHVAMGNLARLKNNLVEAKKHFKNAIEVLKTCPKEQVLAESDGLTAGRLAEIVGTLVNAQESP